MRKSLILSLFVLLSACAPAQNIQVTDGPPQKLVNPNTMPINGIAVAEFQEEYLFGFQVSQKVKQALTSYGFNVYRDDAWKLEDKARILIEGRVEQFVNNNGDELDRVRSAEIFIRDLGDRRILKTITLPRATIVWDAPKTQDFVNTVVGVVTSLYRPEQPGYDTP